MLVIMAIAQRAAAVARVVIVAWTVGAAEATGHAVAAGVDSAARKRIHDRAVVLRDKAAVLPHLADRVGESDGALDRSDGARIDSAEQVWLGLVVVATPVALLLPADDA